VPFAQARFTRIPIVVIEDKLAQIGRRQQETIRGEHGVDVVVNLRHLPGVIDRVEPDRPTVEDQTNDIREGAWAQATAARQVDTPTNFATKPFFGININGHSRITVLGDAATTACVAIGQMRAMLGNI